MYNPKVFSEAGLVRVLAEAITIAKNVRNCLAFFFFFFRFVCATGSRLDD